MILYGCTLQNPNALDSKVLVEFDHVKNGLKIDDEGKLEAFFFFFIIMGQLYSSFPSNFGCLLFIYFSIFQSWIE